MHTAPVPTLKLELLVANINSNPFSRNDVFCLDVQFYPSNHFRGVCYKDVLGPAENEAIQNGRQAREKVRLRYAQVHDRISGVVFSPPDPTPRDMF